jgi:AcrR family transcriptional regulator
MPKVSDAHLAARRRQILDAAATCFARDGFHRTSMQDVVRECGVSAGLVYRYFTSKDDMIVAIVTEWHEQRQALLEPPDGAPPGRAGLAGVEAAYLDLLRSVGDPASRQDLRLGVQVWAETVRSDELLAAARRGVDGFRTALVDVLRGAQAAGDLPSDVDPDALVRVLIAVHQGLRLQTLWDETVDNAAVVRTVRAVLGALAPR